MTSLAELRAIEQERVAAERAAVVAEADARRRAIEEAEAKAKAEAEAKVAAERAEAIRIAKEREDAERAARMHVEAAEAAERARLQAALEQERMVQEIELRRAEVAKKRPTWMVAVTIGAVLAAGALTWFGFERYRESQQAQVAEAEAKRAKAAAEKDAEESRAAMEQMERDLAALDKKVAAGINQVVAATTAAERQAAKENLERLRREQAELQARRDAAKRAEDLRKRREIIIISDECKKNSLAKGCM